MSNCREKPNIILFMVDQLSAKWIEGDCLKAMKLPNIQKLKNTGITFSHAFTNNPVCCPTRATIATGLSAHGHGVLQNGYGLDPEIPTFMNLLNDNGWKTGVCGKVHLDSHHKTFYHDYTKYGYQVVHNTEDPRGGEWLDWIKENYPEDYKNALATSWTTKCANFFSYGPEGENLSKKIDAIRADFNWGTEKHPNNTQAAYTLPFPEEISQTSWVTKKSLDFLKSNSSEQPFFLQISYVQPHLPSCPPERCMDLVDPSKIPEPIKPEWVDNDTSPSCLVKSEGARTTIPKDWREKRQYYFADIVNLDEQLGIIVDELENLGLSENTYILFLSDHGELLLDHGFTGKAERHYDACIRIPLILSGPEIKSSVTNDGLVSLEEIFPTILDMAGIPLPKPKIIKEVQGMEDAGSSEGIYSRDNQFIDSIVTSPGYSLLPIAKGDSDSSIRNEIYVESFNNIDSFTPEYWARTIRTKEWRYTYYPMGSGEQLFCLKNDPNEITNLASNEKYYIVKQEMKDKLMELIILQDYPHSPRSQFALGAH